MINGKASVYFSLQLTLMTVPGAALTIDRSDVASGRSGVEQSRQDKYFYMYHINYAKWKKE